ncbi:1,2-phenylacetyl-CoA epoxidase subunit PaaC [Flavitalea sp. BT771]|uniref:1,2-phenylacetyl-CoA epoxidase subunit PaaC n=1 Tax=Flavitalea sp. BT771 TaxID=3063329 RepID=UPI0026E43C00|nr:1,2-phenylacetyl-CoA epoxidase subunit PaaC [Flavitalea sp. BT771]MDO6433589.1 1,2-phenylacetyl-CoA epoxidase subunit PaaC [Flavitalea sp. BT771]MDV6222506.1 1,2-phenylacetyl-CoA epoxidase subunit PaaC [Flavitalea sp. BT771]
MSESTFLFQYVLHLADDVLILGHRNSEWTGHGPILEQDIAISNIALDLIGQARNFYQYAAQLSNEEGISATEDSLAYLRDGWDFRNCLLAEQTNGDWAKTILRQFFFSAHQVDLYAWLAKGNDTTLAAIGAKAYKEAIYHLRWSSEWVIRLGDGTEESHARMVRALDELWKFTGELHTPVPYELWATGAGIGPDLSLLRLKWEERIKNIFDEAGLTYPSTQWMQTGGKEGRHTEQLGYVLAEMQFLQRAYPGCEW